MLIFLFVELFCLREQNTLQTKFAEYKKVVGKAKISLWIAHPSRSSKTRHHGARNHKTSHELFPLVTRIVKGHSITLSLHLRSRRLIASQSFIATHVYDTLTSMFKILENDRTIRNIKNGCFRPIVLANNS